MDSSSAALPELPAWPSCFISHPQLKTPSIISSGHFYRQVKIKGSALMKAGYKITKAKCAFYKWLCGAGCSARRFLWLIPDFCLSPSFLPSLCSPLQENSHSLEGKDIRSSLLSWVESFSQQDDNNNSRFSEGWLSLDLCYPDAFSLVLTWHS